MKFTKMHGCGNDYVYVNLFEETIADAPALAIKVSDRHFGVGSDGLITIGPSDKADFRMRIYNADGSEAEMCGNGIRCVAKYVYDFGLTDKTGISVETLAGIKHLELSVEDGKVSKVCVNMGAPILSAEQIPCDFSMSPVVAQPLAAGGQTWPVTCVSMGNPHCVVFTDTDVRTLDLEKIGPEFEHHSRFPKRINTEFVNVIDDTHLRMRVWERGSGETLACGTGTCATVVAAVLNGLTKDEVSVELLGGELFIRWDRETDQVYMTGPATVVFSGEIQI
jgi:diaminopimelate epimerase